LVDSAQSYTISLISLLATLVLVIINGIYIYFTKRTLDVALRQSNLVYNPVIGITLGKVSVSPVFGPSRRQIRVKTNLTNVGNAPAIDVLVDAEIVLSYSNIEGEKIIPAYHEPSSIPFIRSGEETKDDPRLSPTFGNTCVAHVLADFQEGNRLNVLRIATEPTKMPYNSSMLRVYASYRNSIGQYFESTYEIYLSLEEIPSDKKDSEIDLIYIPRPKFHAYPISKKELDIKLSERDSKRNLCGW
jgi:hypothetical protein